MENGKRKIKERGEEEETDRRDRKRTDRYSATLHRTKKQIRSYGFAIPPQPGTELGLAMLISEDKEGHLEPATVVVGCPASSPYSGGRVPSANRA